MVVRRKRKREDKPAVADDVLPSPVGRSDASASFGLEKFQHLPPAGGVGFCGVPYGIMVAPVSSISGASLSGISIFLTAAISESMPRDRSSGSDRILAIAQRAAGSRLATSRFRNRTLHTRIKSAMRRFFLVALRLFSPTLCRSENESFPGSRLPRKGLCGQPRTPCSIAAEGAEPQTPGNVK